MVGWAQTGGFILLVETDLLIDYSMMTTFSGLLHLISGLTLKKILCLFGPTFGAVIAAIIKWWHLVSIFGATIEPKLQLLEHDFTKLLVSNTAVSKVGLTQHKIFKNVKSERWYHFMKVPWRNMKTLFDRFRGWIDEL